MSYLEWKEIPPLMKRLKTVRNKNGVADRNCFGTAFFLLGILPHDVMIFTNNSREYVKIALDKMKSIPTVRDSSLIVSYDRRDEIQHASFALTTDPLRGIHRVGLECAVEGFTDLNAIDKYLEEVETAGGFSGPYTHRFFTPEEGLLDIWAREMVRRYSPGWWM